MAPPPFQVSPMRTIEFPFHNSCTHEFRTGDKGISTRKLRGCKVREYPDFLAVKSINSPHVKGKALLWPWEYQLTLHSLTTGGRQLCSQLLVIF